jgi:hypothetical protein
VAPLLGASVGSDPAGWVQRDESTLAPRADRGRHNGLPARRHDIRSHLTYATVLNTERFVGTRFEPLPDPAVIASASDKLAIKVVDGFQI